MKKILAYCLAVLLTVLFAGCAPAAENDADSTPNASLATVRVAGLIGPTGIGLAGLAEAAEQKAASGNYEVSLATAPELLAASFLKGEVDIAALPTNLAASLYNKTGGNVTVLAVNTYGVLYVLERGDTVHSMADLAGKTVYSTGEGANPEYVLRYLLEENGVSDVTLSFFGENEELVANIVAGKAEVALVPEPAASTVLAKVPELRRALDLTVEWDAVAPQSALLMGCVAVKTDYLAAHPQEIAAFLTDYAASMDGTKDFEATAALCEKHGVLPSKELAASALPYCHIGLLTGEAMEEKLAGYLEVLYRANPTSVGGALPEKDFYYVG